MIGPRKPPVILRLRRHFVERWMQRLGDIPSLEDVNRCVAQGQVIRRQQTLFRSDRGRLVKWKMLCEVWNHEAGIILRIDEDHGAAVTVIVPDAQGKWMDRQP